MEKTHMMEPKISMAVSGGEMFGRWFSYEGSIFMTGVNTFMKELEGTSWAPFTYYLYGSYVMWGHSIHLMLFFQPSFMNGENKKALYEEQALTISQASWHFDVWTAQPLEILENKCLSL